MSGGADIVSNMSSIIDVFTALDVAAQAAGAVDWDALPAPELLDALDRLETVRRRATASSHDIAAAVGRRDEQELGGICHTVIADVLRISVAESKRRLRDARQLRPRASLTGQSLPPELPATAKAWNAGILDTEHLRAIQKFMRDLPDHIPSVEVEKAEAFLAGKATELRPDQLEKVAEKLAITINPDGRFSDEDRARQRGFSWCGAQRADGMSAGKLIASPELRAMIDALLAKFAAPGMCNPADQSPMVTGEPSQEVIDRDARSHSQRQHDALAALFRSQLGDPKLGRHRGLPVTVIVSTTLEQLQAAAGFAVTAGGTLMPMADLIRMASHAYHYLLCLRLPQRAGALPRPSQTHRHRRPASGPARQGSRLLRPRM